jgi:uncharacterized protein
MVTRIGVEALQDAIEAQFSCAQCGHCCKGEGLVKINWSEAGRIASALGLTRHRFFKTYAIQVSQNEWILRDRMVPSPNPLGGEEKWCIFLEQRADGLYQCLPHQAKPDQCHGFPANWRNPDSVATCVGLRHLTAQLRRRDSREAQAENPGPLPEGD